MKTRTALQDILAAQQALSGIILQTPLEHSNTLSKMTGNEVYLKLENLQKTGSFKIRGAYYKISQLAEEKRTLGIVTASAGNHAQGVAFAARKYKVPAVVVMPEGAPESKIQATQNYGAEVILHGATYDEAYQKALEVVQEKKATYIHAFDDLEIIAGQGTVGLEIIQQCPDIDVIVVPVGGGGLASGVGIAAKTSRKVIDVVGVQPEGAASSTLSWKTGIKQSISSIHTLADGLAVKSPGQLTFETMQEVVDQFVTVDEASIKKAILILLERTKYLVEGAGAVALAALLDKKLPYKDKKIALILSGGNIDVIKLMKHLST